MGEQKLIQDLGVQKIKREKADRDAVNTGHVIKKRNKAIKEGGGVTTKAELTDPVDENPTLIGENSYWEVARMQGRRVL